MSSRTIEVDDVELELSSTPSDYLDQHIHTDGEWVLVGYCTDDNDGSCENPLDCDCYGEIHHHPRSRYGSRDSDYYDAVGCDSYGDPRLDLIFDNHFQEAFKRWHAKLVDTRGVEWLRDELRQEYDHEEGESDEQFVHDALYQDTNEYANWENVAYADDMRDVLEQMFGEPEFFPGDIDAVLLDRYEHGLCSYSVSGGGMQCRWDTSRGEAVWIPNEYLRSELEKIADPSERYKQAEKYAQQACDVYTDWCNGNIYGVCVDVFYKGELHTDDACWGYIGSDHAEESLTDQMNYWQNWVAKQPSQKELELV